MIIKTKVTFTIKNFEQAFAKNITSNCSKVFNIIFDKVST